MNSYVAAGLPFQLYLIQGVCHLAGKDTVAADREFQKALSLRPKEYLSEMTFSPQVIEAYEASRKIFLEKNKFADQASVSISSSPPFADVFLDGEYVGQTPLTLSDIYGGDHFVQLKQRQYRDWFSRLQIQPRTSLRLQATLTSLAWANSSEAGNGSSEESAPLLQWVSAAHGDPESILELKKLAGMLQVSQITTLTLAPKGLDYSLRVRIYDARKQAFTDDVVVEFMPVRESMQAAQQALLQALQFPQSQVLAVLPTGVTASEARQESEETQLLSGQDQSVKTLDAAPNHLVLEEVPAADAALAAGPSTRDLKDMQENEAASRPVYRRWWFWTLVAVAAAGAGVGTAYALSQGGDGQGTGMGLGFGAGPNGGGVIVGNQRR